LVRRHLNLEVLRVLGVFEVGILTSKDAGQRRTSVPLLQNLLGNAAAVVSDLEDELSGLSGS
jgi:hypothetical protein